MNLIFFCIISRWLATWSWYSCQYFFLNLPFYHFLFFKRIFPQYFQFYQFIFVSVFSSIFATLSLHICEYLLPNVCRFITSYLWVSSFSIFSFISSHLLLSSPLYLHLGHLIFAVSPVFYNKVTAHWVKGSQWTTLITQSHSHSKWTPV